MRLDTLTQRKTALLGKPHVSHLSAATEYVDKDVGPGEDKDPIRDTLLRLGSFSIVVIGSEGSRSDIEAKRLISVLGNGVVDIVYINGSQEMLEELVKDELKKKIGLLSVEEGKEALGLEELDRNFSEDDNPLNMVIITNEVAADTLTNPELEERIGEKYVDSIIAYDDKQDAQVPLQLVHLTTVDALSRACEGLGLTEEKTEELHNHLNNTNLMICLVRNNEKGTPIVLAVIDKSTRQIIDTTAENGLPQDDRKLSGVVLGSRNGFNDATLGAYVDKVSGRTPEIFKSIIHESEYYTECLANMAPRFTRDGAYRPARSTPKGYEETYPVN